MIVNEILQYLKKPIVTCSHKTGIKKKISDLFLTYFIYLFLALCSYFFLYLIDHFIVKYLYNYSILDQMKFRSTNSKIKASFGKALILIVAFIAPFFEEIIFRLPLKLEKVSIGLSLSVLTYTFIGQHFFYFDYNELYSYIRIGIAISVIFLVVRFLPSGWLDIIKVGYYNFFFYFCILSFALMHISNFSPYNNKVYLFYPLFVLPQFIMGVLISFLRMKHGFVVGLALHVLINLGAFIFH